MASELTVRISKTIQERQYEPLTMEVIIKEPCVKANYTQRMEELATEISEELYSLMGIGEEDPEAGGPLEPPPISNPPDDELSEMEEEYLPEGALPKEVEPVTEEEPPEGGDGFDDFFNEGESGQEEDFPY
jgi:hypothetical protein